MHAAIARLVLQAEERHAHFTRAAHDLPRLAPPTEFEQTAKARYYARIAGQLKGALRTAQAGWQHR